MPVMDEFKEEREALKHGTPKQKFTYFMDYYKWHVVAGIAIIGIVVSLIYQIATGKDTALYVCLINAAERGFGENSSDGKDPFMEYAGIDPGACTIIYDTSVRVNSGSPDEVASAQKLMVYIAAAELDVIVTDPSSLERYAYQDDFMDLRELLTPEQFDRYEPYFYYVDGAVMKEVEAASEALDTDYVLQAPNPREPEHMQDPIPVGIYLDGCESIREDYYFQQDEVVLSVLVNTTRPETAAQYIDYLMQ